MMKWQLVEPFFQGAKTYTFGTLTIDADKDGFFEIDNMPAEPLGAIARHVSGEAKIKRGLPEGVVREAAE